jgi:hypothetical protein
MMDGMPYGYFYDFSSSNDIPSSNDFPPFACAVVEPPGPAASSRPAILLEKDINNNTRHFHVTDPTCSTVAASTRAQRSASSGLPEQHVALADGPGSRRLRPAVLAPDQAPVRHQPLVNPITTRPPNQASAMAPPAPDAAHAVTEPVGSGANLLPLKLPPRSRPRKRPSGAAAAAAPAAIAVAPELMQLQPSANGRAYQDYGAASYGSNTSDFPLPFLQLPRAPYPWESAGSRPTTSAVDPQSGLTARRASRPCCVLQYPGNASFGVNLIVVLPGQAPP